jgi:dihydrofolate reductase
MTEVRHIKAIVAMDEGRAIGNAGAIPWRISEDMKHVSALTTGHTVLMGRKTFESLPPKYRPLPNRKNVVVSRNTSIVAQYPDVLVVSDVQEFLTDALSGRFDLPSDTVWLFGGSSVYKSGLPYCDAVHLTAVKGTHPADTFFPEFESDFDLMSEERHEKFVFQVYHRKSQPL